MYSATSAKLRHMIDSCLVGAMSLAAYRRSTAWCASTSHTSAGKLSVGMMPSCAPQRWRAYVEGQQRMLPLTGHHTRCPASTARQALGKSFHLHLCCVTDTESCCGLAQVSLRPCMHACMLAGQPNTRVQAVAHRAVLQQLDDGVQAPGITAIRVHLHQARPAAPAPVATTFAAAPFGAGRDPALRPGAFRLLWAKKRNGLSAHCAARPCCDSAVV